MSKQYPCEKNKQCAALNNLEAKFLPREVFEIRCVQCNELVQVNPKTLLKQNEKISLEAKQEKEDINTHVSIALDKFDNSNPKIKKESSKIIPIISVVLGLFIVVAASTLIIKIVFKTSLSKYKTLSKEQIGQDQVYLNKRKIILDITTDENLQINNKASSELQKTSISSNIKRNFQAQRYNSSKQYSDYIKRYSKIPKNIREIYESFNINQLKNVRELIIQHINNAPEHNYISNIILSEFYSYLSYIEKKPSLNKFAIENLKELNNSYPKTPEWKRSMAFALYFVQDYKKSYQYIVSIKDVFPNDPIVQTLNAVLVYRLQSPKKGLELLERTYLISPKHYLINHFYSDILFEQENYAAAVKIYKKMSFSKTVHPEIMKKVVYSYNQQKEWSALASFYQTYYNQSTDLNIKINTAKALSRSGNFKQALKILDRIDTKNMDNKERYTYLFEKAYAYYTNKDFLEANKIFLEANTVVPNVLINLKYIGNSYFRLGRYYNAIDFYQQAYKIEPSQALQKNIALSYYESKQYQKSVDIFSLLLKGNPKNYIFTFYLAKAYLKMNQLDLALKNAEKALAQAKNNSQIKTFIMELNEQISRSSKQPIKKNDSPKVDAKKNDPALKN